jgi:ubiquinone/menaquinone biosynthesis C-methylase UbiE
MPDAQTSLDRTTAHFDSASDFWRALYEQEGLEGVIYRERMQHALSWIEELRLPPGARVLDAGCGAGLLSVALAEGGLQVIASDASEAMLQGARQTVAERGLQERIEVRHEDVHRLNLPSEHFDAVVALGLLPWVHDDAQTVRELARVLRPGGTLILTADNRMRLSSLIEPRLNPLLTPLKLLRRLRRRLFGQASFSGARWRLHRPRQVHRLLRDAGLRPHRRAWVGFGPFTVLDRPVLGDRRGLWLHEHLERRAGRSRVLRAGGWHYLVAAVKASRSANSSPPRSS